MSNPLAELSWRTFDFFSLQSMKGDNSNDKSTILQGIDILEWVSGDGFVLFGEPNGAIFHMMKELEIRFFKAFQQRLIHFTYAQNLLVAVGIDEAPPDSSSSTSPILKLWDLNRWDEEVSPKCKFSCQLNFGRKVDIAQVSVVAISPKLDTLVIGHSNSSLFYHFGDLQQERSISKWIPLRESTNPIKDGQLAGVAVGVVRNFTTVSCITDKIVSSYVLNPEGNLIKTILHDAKGCERKCWYFSRSNNHLIVAGREMVHLYDMKDCLDIGGENGRCHALGRGSEKVQLVERDGQIVLLTEQKTQIQSINQSNTLTNILNVYDIESRYKAFFRSIPSPCKLFKLDGEIYLLDAEGTLNVLVEAPMESKLEILLRKNLFDLAISIVRRRKTDDLLSGIYFKYGDYLYEKGDFENAVKQYINTFSYVEPSKIIKKFLDGPRIPQLCQYLEALHAENLAIGQHTTLLISVYVKLNEVEKLEHFLEKGDEHLARDGFDVDASIQLIRSANLYHVASKLAIKSRPHIFLDILCQDTHEWERTIRFIEKLPHPMACDFLEIYGPILLENSELKTLELIKNLICSKRANFKQLTKALMSKPKVMEELFGELNLIGELNEPQVRNMLLEQRLKNMQESGKSPSKEQFDELISLLDATNLEYSLIKAQQYNCPPLIIHLLRVLNRTEELFSYMLKEGDLVNAFELCEEKSLHGMWVELISYGTASKSATKKEELLALLKKIATTNSLNPLVILELLSRDESLQVGDIRDFIIEWLERKNTLLRNNQRKIAQQEHQLLEMNKEIEDLENNVQVYQAAKCTVCNNPLQVPAIHFLCRHSYHANCFESYSGNKPDECPSCTNSEGKLHTENDGNERENSDHQTNYQQFKSKLAESTDAMALISEFLLKGQFEQHTQDPIHKQPYNPFEED